MADTQTNVAYARQNLQSYVPNGYDEFLPKLNLACGRLTTSGKWKGSFVAVVFEAASGVITLPPRFMSILSAKFDSWPTQVYSQWFDYMVVGPSSLEESTYWPYGPITDLGDGYVTQTLQETDGVMRIGSSASDDGLQVRIFGVDSTTEEPVVDDMGVEGELVTLSAPFVTTTASFSEITGFQKPVTNSAVTVTLVPDDASANVALAEYQSWETFPSYRRYRIGPSTRTVKVLCQRRFIPMISETDWVIPGDIHALKMALKALALEDAGYEEKAAFCWDRAYESLNAEAKSLRGGNQVPVPTSVFGWGQSIPFTN